MKFFITKRLSFRWDRTKVPWKKIYHKKLDCGNILCIRPEIAITIVQHTKLDASFLKTRREQNKIRRLSLTHFTSEVAWGKGAPRSAQLLASEPAAILVGLEVRPTIHATNKLPTPPPAFDRPSNELILSAADNNNRLRLPLLLRLYPSPLSAPKDLVRLRLNCNTAL